MANQIQDDYYNELESYLKSLSEELNCSYACAGDVWYLRQRSRWTQELEDELIRLYKEGTPPNIFEMTSTIPACKNCKHFQGCPDDIFGTCKMFCYETADYFNGTVTKHNSLAYAMRDSEKHCGREGKWFEQREVVKEEETFSYRKWLKGFFTEGWMFG